MWTKIPEIGVVRSFPTCFFCTHIVFVIIFSNLKLIIFEDQGKYWHILLLSTLILKEEVSLRTILRMMSFFAVFTFCVKWKSQCMIVKSL